MKQERLVCPCIPKRQQVFPGLAPPLHTKCQVMIYPAPSSCSGNFLFFSSSSSPRWKATRICTSSARAGNLMKTRCSNSASKARGMCSPSILRINDLLLHPRLPAPATSIGLGKQTGTPLQTGHKFTVYLMKKFFFLYIWCFASIFLWNYVYSL